MMRVVLAICLLALAQTRDISPKLIKSDESTDRPIIGILTQPYYVNKTQVGSYIAASYVKFIESAGARVAPIHYDASPTDLITIFGKVNGILFPGGGNYITSGYPLNDAGRVLFSFAVASNTGGTHFPLWGTCLGWELLAVLVGDDGVLCQKCYNGSDVNLPLKFTSDAKSSRMFSNFPPELLTVLATQNITANHHNSGISVDEFGPRGSLSDFYTLLSTSTIDGKEFASAVEASSFPFYGTQFHPEKPSFEWNVQQSWVHSAEAVSIGQQLAAVFVADARQNGHKFDNEEDENRSLIYATAPQYDANNQFDQIYLWPSRT